MRRASYLFSALTLCILFQSCAAVTQAPRSVEEDPEHFIRLEGRYGDEHHVGSSRFEHPLTLSAAEWQRLRSSIQLHRHKHTLLRSTAKHSPEPACSPAQ